MHSSFSLFSKNKIHVTVIFIILIFNLIQSYFTPLVDDESYYWVWSQDLDWGYFDHPPMIALWIKIGYSILQNELGVRLITCFANAFVFLFWLDILNPSNKNENSTFWLIALSFVIFQVFGFVSTPDSCLLFFGSFYIWALYRFILNKNGLNSLILGLSMAFLMYSKYHGILLIIFSLLPLLSNFLKTKFFYIAVFISLLLYFPHLIWQVNHDFISFKYHFLHRNDHTVWRPKDLGDYFVGILAFGSPLLLFYIGKSIFRKEKSSFEKSMISVAICTSLFFLIMAFRTRIQPQWFLIVFLVLFPMVYNLVKQLKSKKLIYALTFFTISLFILVRIIIMIPNFIIITPMQKLKNFVLEAQKVNKGIAVFERYQKASAYAFYTKQPAECLSMFNHRKSQFDLWNTEDKIAGKAITFFAIGIDSQNFITDEDNNKVQYNYIPIYTKYPKISVEFPSNNWNLKVGINEINEKIKIKNTTNLPLHLGDSTRFKIGIILLDKKRHPSNGAYITEPKNIILKPNEEKEIKIKSTLYVSEDNKIGYFYILQQKLSGRLISERINIQVSK